MPGAPASARPHGGAPPAGEGSPPAPALTLRIVDIQHAMAKPLPGVDACMSPLTGETVQLTPVVRIYGATPAGQKTCLHLHGVRPLKCHA